VRRAENDSVLANTAIEMIERMSFDQRPGVTDDTLWLRRAHIVGNRRQLLNMITYALGVNALSMRVRRQGVARQNSCLSPGKLGQRSMDRASRARNLFLESDHRRFEVGGPANRLYDG